jgi:RNA polymerase sigma factor (sigma-70 family)
LNDSGPRGLTDETFAQVLAAARANAPWAFERLYTSFAPPVAGFLRLRGASDPDGLTNEVMLGVFRGLDGFEGDVSGFRSWVFTIAHRRLVDDRRRRAARVQTSELDDGYEHLGGDVEQEAVSQLEHGTVRDLLEHLTEEQRDVILLRIVADLSVEAVATILGKREGAVKMLQRRGLARLRRLLEAEAVTS